MFIVCPVIVNHLTIKFLKRTRSICLSLRAKRSNLIFWTATLCHAELVSASHRLNRIDIPKIVRDDKIILADCNYLFCKFSCLSTIYRFCLLSTVYYLLSFSFFWSVSWLHPVQCLPGTSCFWRIPPAWGMGKYRMKSEGKMYAVPSVKAHQDVSFVLCTRELSCR